MTNAAPTADAIAIYQNALDVLSDALITNDFETFADYLHLPHRIVTEEFTAKIQTRTEVQTQFQGFTAALRGLGVDGYTRTARGAEFTSPTQIRGTHACYLTDHGKLVVPEFPGSMVLDLRDGRWGSIQVQHHMRYVAWPEITSVAGQRV